MRLGIQPNHQAVIYGGVGAALGCTDVLPDDARDELARTSEPFTWEDPGAQLCAEEMYGEEWAEHPCDYEDALIAAIDARRDGEAETEVHPPDPALVEAAAWAERMDYYLALEKALASAEDDELAYDDDRQEATGIEALEAVNAAIEDEFVSDDAVGAVEAEVDAAAVKKELRRWNEVDGDYARRYSRTYGHKCGMTPRYKDKFGPTIRPVAVMKEEFAPEDELLCTLAEFELEQQLEQQEAAKAMEAEAA